MPSTAPWFVLTPFGLTSLALLLFTVAFLIFLAQSRPRSAAGRWMLGHEVFLGVFLLSNLALTATFQTIWYPVEYLSFVVGMACLLQFALAFPRPVPRPRLARRLLIASSVSIVIVAGPAVVFWLSPHSASALVLRNAGLLLGLWQSLAALFVLTGQTIELETAGAEYRSGWRRWRAVVQPQRHDARAAQAMLLAALSIIGLALTAFIYRLWPWPLIPETLFNIAWSIGLMLMLSVFAIRYLIYAPDPISFRVKLTLGTLAAVLTSVWLLSLVYPFDLEIRYDAARHADVQAVQIELARVGFTAQPDRFAAVLPDNVTLIAVCLAAPAPDAQPLFVREGAVDLSGLCGPRFLIDNTLSSGQLDTLMVVYRFIEAGQTYLVGFAYAPYLALLNQFTVPIGLVMLGSTVIIMLLLPLTFYQNLVKPLNGLLLGVQRVKHGQLTATVPVQSNDEIGLLTETFNTMATDLQVSLTKLESQVAAYQQAEQAVREQREQLRALTARLAEVEEIERNKLARELHDQAGQNLTALSLTIKLVQTQLSIGSPDPATLEQMAIRLDDAADLVRQTTQRIRHVMDDLQPPALDEFGLVAALRWHATRFTARTNVLVVVHGSEVVPRLARQSEVALFRIAQEALTNVIRHAHATKVEIHVQPDPACIALIIRDNGRGFDPLRPPDMGGRSTWGLRIMAERAEAIGGAFRVESAPDRGTQIIIEVKA